MSVNNFTVNGILQIDYIHNRLIPSSVLLFRKMQTPAQTLSISDESRFISSQTSSGSMESLTQLSSQICCSTVSMLRDFLLLLTSAANEPLSNLIIIFITFYFQSVLLFSSNAAHPNGGSKSSPLSRWKAYEPSLRRLKSILSDILVSRRTPFESSISLSGKLCIVGATNFSILVTLASMALSMWRICAHPVQFFCYYNELIFIFYGAILQRYKVTGYPTVK